MSGKTLQEKFKLGLEIGTFVISIIALLISWQSSLKANQISERANQAQIILVNALDVQRSYNQELTSHICRTQIRLSNIGGVKTSLISVGYTVRMNDKVDTFEISDYGNPGYLGDDIMLFGYIWNENNAPEHTEILSHTIPEENSFDFPYEINGNSTVDLFADFIIWVSPEKYKFHLWWLRNQPANPTYSNDYLDSPHISVEYSLKFSNGDTINTPVLVCFFFEK